MPFWKDDFGVDLDAWERAYFESCERWTPGEENIQEWGPMCVWPMPVKNVGHTADRHHPHEHRETVAQGHSGYGWRTVGGNKAGFIRRQAENGAFK